MGDAVVPFQPPTVRERILLHLLDFAKAAGSYDVPLEITQSGVARATWIDVHHVGQYVRPLISEGLVRERTAHVHGGTRKRRVYDLTDSGKLKAYSLREGLKGQSVLVQGVEGLTEETLAEVTKSSGGRISILDAIRQFVHTGSVDLKVQEIPARPRTVRFLADAPAVVDFVGRRKELDVIAGEGTASRVFVARGVAGIGKSSLGARACELLAETHHAFWHRVRSWDTPQSILIGLAAFLSALGKPSLRASLRDGAAETSLRILRQDLAGLPCLLVFDDAHEARGDLLNFLRFLKDVVAMTPEVRLLVLTRHTVGFYDRRDVVLQELVHEIELGGLEAEEAKVLLGERDPERVPKVGGHPLLLKLLRSAPAGAEKAELVRDAFRFIEEAIYADLTEPLRQILKLASLYRVPVPPEALLRDPNLSRSDLDTLLGRGLIMSTRDTGLEVHDAVREFFSGILVPGERRELGRFAAGHLFALAKRAREEAEYPVAIKCLFNALEVVPEDGDAMEIAEALGDVQERTGDYAAGLSTYERAVTSAKASSDRARIHRKRASIHIARGELAEASQELERGFTLLGAGGDGERAWLYVTRAAVAVRLEEWEEALDDSRTALDHFESARDVLGRIRALTLLAHAEMHRDGGNVNRSQESLETALALAEGVQDSRIPLSVHTALAYLYAYKIVETKRAEEHLAAIESLLDPAEESAAMAGFLVVKGLLNLWNKGDFAQAEACFRRMFAIAEKLGSHANTAYARFGLAHCAIFQERFDEARSEMTQLANAFKELGALPSSIDATLAAAGCHLFLKDQVGFRRLIAPLAEGIPVRGTEAREARTKTWVALYRFLQGERDAACALLDEALAKAEPAEGWEPHFVYSIVCDALGDHQKAADHRTAAERLLQRYGQVAHLGFLPSQERLLRAALKGR